MHLNTLVQEAQERVSELSAQVENEGFSLDNTEKEKQLKAWEWRYRLYRRNENEEKLDMTERLNNRSLILNLRNGHYPQAGYCDSTLVTLGVFAK